MLHRCCSQPWICPSLWSSCSVAFPDRHKAADWLRNDQQLLELLPQNPLKHFRLRTNKIVQVPGNMPITQTYFSYSLTTDKSSTFTGCCVLLWRRGRPLQVAGRIRNSPGSGVDVSCHDTLSILYIMCMKAPATTDQQRPTSQPCQTTSTHHSHAHVAVIKSYTRGDAPWLNNCSNDINEVVFLCNRLRICQSRIFEKNGGQSEQ